MKNANKLTVKRELPQYVRDTFDSNDAEEIKKSLHKAIHVEGYSKEEIRVAFLEYRSQVCKN